MDPLFLGAPVATPLTFSGHETFALRSTWLKKAFDVLLDTPDLFFREDAFVLLGVGKNMAQSIRYWGRVCGVFERAPDGSRHTITWLGKQLLADDGWDPFLATPAASWLLHWQIAARPEAAFTWHYTFNLLKGGEFAPSELVQQILSFLTEHAARSETSALRQAQRTAQRTVQPTAAYRLPSQATLTRDVECMLNCYLPRFDRRFDRLSAPHSAPPTTREQSVEDMALCPLTSLNLIQWLPGQNRHRLVSGRQESLPDALVAYAILKMLQASKRTTIAFSDLAYAPRSPGRVFRIEEDELLRRLQRLDEVTDGRAYYTDQAGIRQVSWPNVEEPGVAEFLLDRAFQEM